MQRPIDVPDPVTGPCNVHSNVPDPVTGPRSVQCNVPGPVTGPHNVQCNVPDPVLLLEQEDAVRSWIGYTHGHSHRPHPVTGLRSSLRGTRATATATGRIPFHAIHVSGLLRDRMLHGHVT